MDFFLQRRRPHSSLDDLPPMKHTAVSPDLLYEGRNTGGGMNQPRSTQACCLTR